MENYSTIDMDQFYIDRTRHYRALNRTLNSSRYGTKESIVDWLKIDTMIKNWERVAKQIPIEEVMCRRKRKVTDEYRKLEQKFRECQTEIEQAVTMYSLLYC